MFEYDLLALYAPCEKEGETYLQLFALKVVFTKNKWFKKIPAFTFWLPLSFEKAKACNLDIDSYSYFHYFENLNESNSCKGCPGNRHYRLHLLTDAVSLKSSSGWESSQFKQCFTSILKKSEGSKSDACKVERR